MAEKHVLEIIINFCDGQRESLKLCETSIEYYAFASMMIAGITSICAGAIAMEKDLK